MPRAWVWTQLIVAWLPIWALFTTVIVVMHGSDLLSASIGSARMVAPGALLGALVYGFASRLSWPHPFKLSFVAVHVVAAIAFAAIWFAAVCAIDSIVTHHMVLMNVPGAGPFLITGVWLYLVVASTAYANIAAQRSAQLEANAARMQLDALRTQLHPHFLFNALHTVVQLIPLDPRAAVGAAEQLADALRSTLEERRDTLTLREEWAFVQRYLAIERVRFGERLQIREAIDADALEGRLPTFALQTLVENALRHGAAPRVEATAVQIAARVHAGMLEVRVSDDGGGADLDAIAKGSGTGLARLRERMRWLYGDAATLNLSSRPRAGFEAVLRVPQTDDDSPAPS